MTSLVQNLLDTTTSSAGAASAVVSVVVLAVAVIYLASYWAIFGKAGQPGWAAIIPIYNTFVLLRVCGRPAWWFLFLLIPLVDIIITLILVFDLAKAFGHGAGFGLGLLFLRIISIRCSPLVARAMSAGLLSRSECARTRRVSPN